MLLVVVKDYFINTSFHGLRFIADSERHWTERIFWLICCLLSWYGSALLIHASWTNFQNNAISFAAETLYGDWDTDFPSVSICETDNNDRIDEVRSRLKGSGKRSYDLDEVYKEITYFRGQANFIRNTCFSNDKVDETANCPATNFSIISRDYRTPCVQAFANCKWNNRPFNCCDHFLPLPTEMGICYSINNIHTQKQRELNMMSNKKTGPSTLYIELRVQSTVYVLAKQDVPSLNSIDRVKFMTKNGTHFHRWYLVKEVENEPAVHDVTVKQRGCRFPDEGGLQVYEKYSYTGCLTQCRKEAQISKCGCASHQTPNIKGEETCDLKGIKCLNEHYMVLSVLRHKNSNKDKLFCPCMLSCEDQELKDTYGTMDNSGHPNLSMVEISMESLPIERFKRNVVRGKLDLVVSMGGTTGLFVGASLLSFVELIYYFTLRAYSTTSHQATKQQIYVGEAPAVTKPTQAAMNHTKLANSGSIPISKIGNVGLLRAQHSFNMAQHM